MRYCDENCCIGSLKTKLGIENGPGAVKVTVTKNRKAVFWMISHERLHIFKQYLYTVVR